MRKRSWLLAILTLGLALAPTLYEHFRPKPLDPRVLPDDAVDASIDYSNILPEDYVGPSACIECHPTQHARWKRHSHSKMNRLPDPDSVQADFRDQTLQLPNGTAHFTMANGEYFMTVKRGSTEQRRYQVTRTVGSRFMQFYIGKQLSGPEEKSDGIYQEHMLPFSYWFKLQRWLPRQFFDPDGDETLLNGVPQYEGLDRKPDVRSYQAVCMNCHNTFAYSYRIFRPDYVGFKDATVAATLGPLSKHLSPTVPVEPTVDSFKGIPNRLEPEKHLVTLGISCESCHFGGREHAKREREIRFLPTSKYIQILSHDPEKEFTSQRKDPMTSLGICVQCHSGHGRMYPNGAGKSNSREALDFHAGYCATKMRCTQCHEPHTPGEPSGGPTSLSHLALCIKCHPQYKAPEAALAHGRHGASANVNCMDCHMPRYTQGLDELIRTHRITMPVEETMVAAGSANACNLCHLDKSQRWTLQQLEKGWGKKITPQETWASLSSLDQPAGEAWLASKDSHMRLVAGQSYARSPLGAKKLPQLIAGLNDAEPLTRVFFCSAVQRVRGESHAQPLPVDITAAPAQRQRQIEAWLRQLKP